MGEKDRVSDNQTRLAALSALERDREYWLDDGNIVLVAGRIGFRVYRGLLVAQSSVFGDMFTAASRSSAEQYENVPIVQLFDSPVDVLHLLRVLLPKSQKDVVKERYDLKTEFHILSALLRLSHKYQIDDVEQRAVSALCALYSTNLRKWLELEVDVDPDDDFCAIAAVNLARLTDTPSILPSALYHCTLLGSKVLKGFSREDGSVEHLSQDDLGRCMDAAPMLAAATSATMLTLAQSAQRSGDALCASPVPCRVARKTVHDTLRKSVIDSFGMAALNGNDGHWVDVGLCDKCVGKLVKEQLTLIGEAWARLPSVFKVEDLKIDWPKVQWV